nr:uncharacterized protein LOC108014264 isoform X7 [Drosophila suzukii]
MEHLDLAGYHVNSSQNWNRLGAFEQNDAVCLSSSQRVLEPIMEETSEDEESDRRSQEHRSTILSSIESEISSVIRLEEIRNQIMDINPKKGNLTGFSDADIDTMSDREFFCPPKRPRHCLESDPSQSLQDSVQLRRLLDPERNSSVECDLVTEAVVRNTSGSQGQQSSSGSRRGCTFKDFYSENYSYHSLSRSSSLMQFESLERQFTLQEQHHSMNSLGNSSPSLTYEVGAETWTTNSNPESRKGSASSLSLMKRFEPSDYSRLHQTYYELNKLNLETQQPHDLFSKDLYQADLKPNFENSSSFSSCSDSRSPCLSSCLVSVGAPTTKSGTGVQYIAAALSKDSSYCDPRTQHEKSKSMSKNFDKLCEDEKLLLLEEATPHSHMNIIIHDLCQPKIEQTVNTVATQCSPSSSINSSPVGDGSQSESSLPLSPPPRWASTSSSASFTWLRNSLPDICESRGLLSVGIINTKSKNEANGYDLAAPSISSRHHTRSSSSINSCGGKPLLGACHSVNELLKLGQPRSLCHTLSSQRNCHSNNSASSSCEELHFERETRRKDLFLDCNNLSKILNDRAWRAVGAASAGYLNASNQNLTLLSYKDKLPSVERLQNKHKRSQPEEMSERNSVDGRYYKQVNCRRNFLLDEISKLYDKNVSILTDKRVLDDQFPSPDYCHLNTPEEFSQVHHVQLTIKPPPRQKCPLQMAVNLSINNDVKTFDEDPTNLCTSYAKSLEQCHFDVQWEAKTDILQRPLATRRFQTHLQKLVDKEGILVSSTPNLSACDGRHQAEDIYESSTHTSMHQSKPLSILLAARLRNSFGKGVSFCPVVSKYSWQEQSAVEPPEDHFSEGELGPPIDEKLLNNADKTVVHNSKDNESVAALFEQEKTQFLREQAIAQGPLSSASAHAMNNNSSFKETVSSECETKIQALDCLDQKPETYTAPEREIVLGSPVRLGVVVNLSINSEPPNVSTSTANAGLLSLPILSKPPTNRAHHILYASQPLLQRYEQENRQNHNMPLDSALTTVGRAEDKYSGARGLFSRLTTGLRSSLRRKKEGQRDMKAGPKQPLVIKASPKKDSRQSTDKGGLDLFVHNHLKPPIILMDAIQLNESQIDSVASTANMHSRQLARTSTPKKVTGRPPLPKLPPRSGILAHTPPEAVGSTDSVAHSTGALMTAEREQQKQFTDQLTAGIQMTRVQDIEPWENITQKQLGGSLKTSRPTVVTAVTVAVPPVDAVGKMGLIETNLDTHETVISGRTRSLMDISFHPHSLPHKRYIVKQLNVYSTYDMDKMDGQTIKSSTGSRSVEVTSFRRPHKSMEFLLDKENQKNVLPPENELQKSHDHSTAALSEHQLRVQASLQRLNIPDWYRDYNKQIRKLPDVGNAATNSISGGLQLGNFTRKGTQESGRWLGLNSKTTSLSSLGSDRSPLLMSPSANSHHGGHNTYPCVPIAGHGSATGQTGVSATRWSTSHLSSTQTSPSVSQRGNFARGAYINSSFMSVAIANGGLRNSYRQPYLGWRSTEKLSHWTPHERLANSLLTHRTKPSPIYALNENRIVHSVTPEIQSSIKEVTSAIVHYVDHQHQIQHSRSRSASPNLRYENGF